MPRKVLQLLADGNEEVGTVISSNVLMRGGYEVTVAAVGLNDHRWALGAKGQKTVPTTTIEELGDAAYSYDIILVPGGVVASKYLASRKDILNIVEKHYNAGTLSTFLCAGPYVAKAAGIHKGKKLTSNPLIEADFSSDYDYQHDRVVKDGNVLTSRGPGTAFEFAFAILEHEYGEGCEKIEKLKPGMVLPPLSDLKITTFDHIA